ncbi:tRNA(Met) cytidine acetyltransferase [Marinobacter sp. EhC06]|jgi:tRNA(Met) cytidine acetyltransferase|uniref:tRNA(Met) cytidine acetyltransferase TmcA n=1 Tax=Marinobacter TaxID=2742 RepID=UPI0007D9C371|nr:MULTISPECIES: GNAT family N-acetyltransferase [unclassified Marinobacter]OAN88664.1 tRNA(Met) cytidine acetyltransferase [Marinobacter sp. EhN04]OAN91646.1 tRNA(Met) cytidine acetyltransferase [Marinobacter sp. EhC06]
MSHRGPETAPDAAAWRALQASLAARGERRLVLLEGNRENNLRWLSGLLPELELQTGVWTGPADRSPDPRLTRIVSTEARQWLGREVSMIVWDGWQGNPPDAFAALSGALTAGGLLFWLMPPLDDWHRFADPDYHRTGLDHGGEHPFAARMADVLADHEAVIRISTGSATSPLPAMPLVPEQSFRIGTTRDQEQLIQRLVRFGLGRRRRPLVVTADRGRGKSATLGMAAAELLEKGRQEIVVTAPSQQNVEALFRHAREVLADQLDEVNAETLTTRSGGRLRYVPVRELLALRPEAEVVLVDEAAALPAPLLKSVLLGWPRVAFSTTVHGYEGAGRGFAIRFRQVLEQSTPHWQSVTLTEPVRWSGSDPLEALISRLFLLAADGSGSAAKTESRTGELVIESWQPATAGDEPLSNAFGLLVDAHYRTSPADLRQWLDDTAARTWRARIGDRTVGILWCALEGGLSPELAEQVSLGTRRIRGHLLPQSLASHSGYPEAAALKALRVVRIAVSDDARRSGIGQSLVEAARAYTIEQGVDYLGTSFGGSAELLAFWQACGLHVVRVGLQQEASSGEYPLQMIKGISQPGLEMEGRIRTRLSGHWLTLVPDNWHGLQPQMLADITADQPPGLALDADDLRDLRNFANGHRGFQVMVPVLRKLSQAPGIMAWLRDQDGLTLWCRSVLQGRSWSSLQAEKLCLGQREGEDHLRQLVRDLLENGPGL